MQTYKINEMTEEKRNDMRKIHIRQISYMFCYGDVKPIQIFFLLLLDSVSLSAFFFAIFNTTQDQPGAKKGFEIASGVFVVEIFAERNHGTVCTGTIFRLPFV